MAGCRFAQETTEIESPRTGIPWRYDATQSRRRLTLFTRPASPLRESWLGQNGRWTSASTSWSGPPARSALQRERFQAARQRHLPVQPAMGEGGGHDSIWLCCVVRSLAMLRRDLARG